LTIVDCRFAIAADETHALKSVGDLRVLWPSLTVGQLKGAEAKSVARTSARAKLRFNCFQDLRRGPALKSVDDGIHGIVMSIADGVLESSTISNRKSAIDHRYWSPIMPLPKVVRVQQNFDASHVADIPKRIAGEVGKLELAGRLRAGQTVAVTAGSRGVANIAMIIKGVVDELKLRGAKPFIVPAMGSHGGGTAEGQEAVLQHYGINETTMGVPIRATMETTQIGVSPQGIPVFLDNYALEADHIVVVNRIKPHTDFDGDIESGLCKMMAIGLGKHTGAIHYHRANINYGYYTVITDVARVVRQNSRILFGLGIVENAYDQTAIIEAMLTQDIEVNEKRLLQIAKSNLARIPFDHGDVLVIDEMGKNISGAGMDTNVIGRNVSQRERAPTKPFFTRIVVRDLSDESYGNAVGIGLADIVTRRLVNKIDYKPTYINAVTSTNVEAARIPVTFDTDREALETAFSTCGTGLEDCRLIWIKNTLRLDEFIATEALLEEIHSKSNLKVLEQIGELPFDRQGNLAALL
jgi:hypothetical protein